MRKARRKGQLTEVGSLLDGVLGDLGLETLRAAFQVGERWEEAVGREVARHARPTGLRQGTLEIEVDTSVWCQQLQMQRLQILSALREVLGDEAPTELRFRVGYSRRP